MSKKIVVLSLFVLVLGYQNCSNPASFQPNEEVANLVAEVDIPLEEIVDEENTIKEQIILPSPPRPLPAEMDPPILNEEPEERPGSENGNHHDRDCESVNCDRDDDQQEESDGEEEIIVDTVDLFELYACEGDEGKKGILICHVPSYPNAAHELCLGSLRAVLAHLNQNQAHIEHESYLGPCKNAD